MFVFSTRYKNTNPVTDEVRVYGSYVFTENKEEALRKMAVRNIGEYLSDCDSFPVENLPDAYTRVINAVDLFQKKHYKHCLHAVTFMSHVLLNAGLLSPKQVLGDMNIVHELIHYITNICMEPEEHLIQQIKNLQQLYDSISH